MRQYGIDSNRVQTGQTQLVSFEPLEQRKLLAATITNGLSDLSVAPSAAPTVLNLSTGFDDPAITGRVVRMVTTLGNIDIQLEDTARPNTVARFLEYVNAGDYNDVIINRGSDNAATGDGTDEFVIQTGGFKYAGPVAQLTSVTDRGNLNDEITPPISNLAGTVSFAKAGPNDTGSSFFFNVSDNPELDTESGGFAVFGHVVNNTIQTISAIADVPHFNANAIYGTPSNSLTFGTLPLRNLVNNTIQGRDNYIIIESASVVPELTYTVTGNTNPGLVTPTITNGQLSLAYTAGVQGTSTLTVQATDLLGNTVADTVNVNVIEPIVIGTGGAKQLSYVDADGTTVTIAVKKGTGTVQLTADSVAVTTDSKGTVATGVNVRANAITITGASSSTELTITTKGGDGRALIGSISSDAGMKKLSAKTTDLFGNVAIAGLLKEATLGSSTGDTFSGGGIGKLTVSGAFLADLNSSTSLGDTKISGGLGSSQWNIATTAGKLDLATTGSTWSGFFGNDIKELKVAGDASGTYVAHAIKKMSVGGRLIDAVVALTKTVGEGGRAIDELKVSGAISNASFRANGNIGKVSSSGMIGSLLLAGVNTLTVGQILPDKAADYSAPAKIDSVTIKSVGGAVSFSDSSIAAVTLGKIKLGLVGTANNSTKFGVGGDTMAEVSGNLDTGISLKLKKLNDPATLATQIAGAPFGDFSIALL